MQDGYNNSGKPQGSAGVGGLPCHFVFETGP